MDSLARATRKLAIRDEVDTSAPMDVGAGWERPPDGRYEGESDEELCECYHALTEVMFNPDFGRAAELIRQYRFTGTELTNYAAEHGEPGVPAAALRAAETGRADHLNFFFSRGIAAPMLGLQLPPPRALDNECLYRAAVGGHLEAVEYLLEPLGGGLTAEDAAATLARIRATLGDDPPELWKRPDIYSLLDQK